MNIETLFLGNGLRVVLYDEAEEYIESKNSDDLGFKFLAHSSVEPPFLKELGGGLAPGFHYLIALREKEVSLPKYIEKAPLAQVSP